MPLPLPSRQPPRRRRAGFTLVEILIVVVILGILATIVMANVADSDDDARRGVFVRNLKHFTQGLELYVQEHNALPEDTSTGVCPAALQTMFDASRFERRTPIGGEWDVEVNDSGVTLAVGVHFNGGPERNAAYMARIDAVCDDGDLATGNFREIAANRYYWVLE